MNFGMNFGMLKSSLPFGICFDITSGAAQNITPNEYFGIPVHSLTWNGAGDFILKFGPTGTDQIPPSVGYLNVYNKMGLPTNLSHWDATANGYLFTDSALATAYNSAVGTNTCAGLKINLCEDSVGGVTAKDYNLVGIWKPLCRIFKA